MCLCDVCGFGDVCILCDVCGFGDVCVCVMCVDSVMCVFV